MRRYPGCSIAYCRIDSAVYMALSSLIQTILIVSSPLPVCLTLVLPQISVKQEPHCQDL
jgi:hypothetical protein